MTDNLTPALIGKLMDGDPNLFMSFRPLPLQGAANNRFGLRFYNLILTPPRLAPDWLPCDVNTQTGVRNWIGLLLHFRDHRSRGRACHALSGNRERLTAADALLSLPSDLATKIATNPPRLYRMYFGTE